VRASLLRLARVVTPNIPEAEVLTGMAIGSREAMLDAARRLVAMGCRAVLLKGGHLPGDEVVDLLLEDGRVHEFAGPRIAGPHTHGTGCAMAAAVTAGLALGADLPAAVEAAKAYVAGAMRNGVDVGRGHQPLDHFWQTNEGRYTRVFS
jgi:hydroxymethylpyrimidine/phosphomethylpyrimidine kinase